MPACSSFSRNAAGSKIGASRATLPLVALLLTGAVIYAVTLIVFRN